jgi:CHAD domain-containing protein
MRDAPANPAYALLQAALDEALRRMTAKRLTDASVHETRKSIKRARAALRLLRPGMDEADYQRENVTLRDAGRTLSPLRDAKSLLEAFEAFASRHATPLSAIDIAPLRRTLRARRAQARRAFVDTPGQLRAGIRFVEACRKRTRRPNLARIEPQILIDGLRRIYRKARKAFGEARTTQSSQSLHEWRKQVKCLRTASVALSAAGTNHLQKIAERAKRVADLLGDDHDLYSLRTFLRDAEIDAKTSEAMNALIVSRRAKLQERAIDRERELFGKKPERIVARAELA